MLVYYSEMKLSDKNGVGFILVFVFAGECDSRDMADFGIRGEFKTI